MMDESFLIETIKDAVCFVSPDPLADLKLAHSRDSPHRSVPRTPDPTTLLYSPSKCSENPILSQQVCQLAVTSQARICAARRLEQLSGMFEIPDCTRGNCRWTTPLLLLSF